MGRGADGADRHRGHRRGARAARPGQSAARLRTTPTTSSRAVTLVGSRWTTAQVRRHMATATTPSQVVKAIVGSLPTSQMASLERLLPVLRRSLVLLVRWIVGRIRGAVGRALADTMRLILDFEHVAALHFDLESTACADVDDRSRDTIDVDAGAPRGESGAVEPREPFKVHDEVVASGYRPQDYFECPFLPAKLDLREHCIVKFVERVRGYIYVFLSWCRSPC